MDSPFCTRGSFAQVISSAEDVARALLDLVEPLKDAPPAQFRHLATNLAQAATLLSCALHLHDANQLLFKPELATLLSDVNSHFGVIQESVKRWVKPARGRWRRLKWLYWSGSVADLIRRLQLLMACLDVVIMVAAMAVDKSVESPAWKIVLDRSQAVRAIEEARFQTADLYRSHVEKEPLVDLPRPYRSFLPLAESTRHVAEWLSTMFSAPAVPLKGPAGGPAPPGIVKYERSKYAFAPTTRPTPCLDLERSRLIFAHDSIHLAALSRFGLQYTIEDCETASKQPEKTCTLSGDSHLPQEGKLLERNVVVQVDKNIGDFEISLLVSASEVLKAIPSPEWRPLASPWMRLAPVEILGRLLKAWTVLADKDVDYLLHLPTPQFREAIKSNADSSSGTGRAMLKFSPDPDGEEFNREEFERSESLRDWLLHPPAQQKSDPQRVSSGMWDSLSFASDAKLAKQPHHYPVLGSQPPALMLPSIPMPGTLRESPRIDQRPLYSPGVDPTWSQELQERIHLRDRVQDLEQKLQFSKDEAKVAVMELENKFDDARKTERDLATRLAQEHEMRLKIETELKKFTVDKAQVESKSNQVQGEVNIMRADLGAVWEEVTRLKGDISAKEAISVQSRRSDETCRELETLKDELESIKEGQEQWRLEKTEHQADLHKQACMKSEAEISIIQNQVAAMVAELGKMKEWQSENDKSEESSDKETLGKSSPDLEEEKARHGMDLFDLEDQISRLKERHEEEVRKLGSKIKKLTKGKLKLQLELDWEKENLERRVQAEREAGKAAAISEMRDIIEEGVRLAVKQHMDEVMRRQAEAEAEIEVEVEAEVPENIEREESATPVVEDEIEPSVVHGSSAPASASVDVMSFVVSDVDGENWPDDETDPDREPVAGQDDVKDCPQLNEPFQHPLHYTHPTSAMQQQPVPRVEDFLVVDTESYSRFRNESIPVSISRPWKGMSGIKAPALHGISPLYIRGSELGGTLYCGSSPVHVRQLAEGYTPDTMQPYLTISRSYLEPQVLDQFGLNYVELEDGMLSLDPRLCGADIEKLFHESYHYWEIEAFKSLQKQGKTAASGGAERDEPGEGDESDEDNHGGGEEHVQEREEKEKGEGEEIYNKVEDDDDDDSYDDDDYDTYDHDEEDSEYYEAEDAIEDKNEARRVAGMCRQM